MVAAVGGDAGLQTGVAEGVRLADGAEGRDPLGGVSDLGQVVAIRRKRRACDLMVAGDESAGLGTGKSARLGQDAELLVSRRSGEGIEPPD